MTAAAAQFGMLLSASAQSAKPALPLIKPGENDLFGPLKHINAVFLNIAYAEAGPACELSSSPRSAAPRRAQCGGTVMTQPEELREHAECCFGQIGLRP